MSGYLDRIQAAALAGHLGPSGGVIDVHVDHLRGCHAPGRPCTCHPTITATVDGQRLVIGDDGEILERRALS